MNVLILAAAIAAITIWGGSPVATRIAVTDLSPLAVTLSRTLLGGLAAIPFLLLLRLPLPVRREQRILLAVSGFCGFIAFPLLFTIGVHKTSANHASMILAALPVFTGAIAMAWDRRRPVLGWGAGCLVALAGEVALIADAGGAGSNVATIESDLIVLVSNLFAALGYVSGARLQQSGYPALGATFWGVALYALVLLPFAPLVLDPAALAPVSTAAWLGVIYLGVAVTIVGYVSWYWALGRGGIARIGLIQFFQPVTGIVFAWILLGETLSTGFVAASAVIFAGVWIAMRGR